MHKQEEILWRHKSRVQWLNEGVKNTKLFHRSMIHRLSINRIMKLEDSQGNTLLNHQEIMHELTDLYKDLLFEPQVDRTSEIERVVQKIPTIITQEQNEALMTPITQEKGEHIFRSYLLARLQVQMVSQQNSSTPASQC
jgi:hypothetical protein